MAAYVIVDLVVTDPAEFEAYRKLVPATLAAYDGRYLVRGGRSETLEGDWTPERIVVLEFPDMDRARAWWASEIYREPKAMRERSARSRMIAVEGVPPGV
jgi:uncharacterized protein (DUF1330 family)